MMLSVETILDLIVKLSVPTLTALTILLKVVKDPTLINPVVAVTVIPVQSDIISLLRKLVIVKLFCGFTVGGDKIVDILNEIVVAVNELETIVLAITI